MSAMWSDTELDLRARRYRQLRAAWSADPARRDLVVLLQQREDAVGGVRDLIGRFLAGAASVQDLRGLLDVWAPETPLLGFVGPVGIMVLDQFADDGVPGEVDDALRAALSLPADLDESCARLDALAAYVEGLRSRGSSVEVRRLPYFVSWFWMVQDSSRRPLWPSGEAVFSKLGWLPSRSAPIAVRYRAYSELRSAIAARCGSISPVPGEIEFDEIGGWLHYDDQAIGVDETLLERCAQARVIRPAPTTDQVADAEHDAERTNLRVMQAEVDRLGRLLGGVVADRLGTEVETSGPSNPRVADASVLRADAWVAWRVRGASDPAPSIRLWATADGLFVVPVPATGPRPDDPDGRAAMSGILLDSARAGAFDTLVSDVGDAVAELAPTLDAAGTWAGGR
jgi:hypothetical protein